MLGKLLLPLFIEHYFNSYCLWSAWFLISVILAVNPVQENVILNKTVKLITVTDKSIKYNLNIGWLVMSIPIILSL